MATALAIQGIGGMNSFSAGFLYHLRQEKFKPQIISVTSGAIRCLYDFLLDDPEKLALHYRDQKKTYKKSIFSKELQGFLIFLKSISVGKEGVFKVKNPFLNFIENYSSLLSDPLSAADALLPAQSFESTTRQEIFDHMAETFNQSDIPIITNAYNYDTGKTAIFLNTAALKFLENTRFQPNTTPEFEIGMISGDTIRGALQLIQYGPYKGLLDGAYQYNPYLPPLKKANHIALVTVVPLSHPLKPLKNYFDIEDFKIKMMFLNSTHAEISTINLINRLIDQKIITDPSMNKIKLDLYEPSIIKGYFDYFVEDPELFRDGYAQGEKFMGQFSNS